MKLSVGITTATLALLPALAFAVEAAGTNKAEGTYSMPLDGGSAPSASVDGTDSPAAAGTTATPSSTTLPGVKAEESATKSTSVGSAAAGSATNSAVTAGNGTHSSSPATNGTAPGAAKNGTSGAIGAVGEVWTGALGAVAAIVGGAALL